MTKPKAPPGLAAGGRRLWRDVLATFELRADELRVLEAAARTSVRCGGTTPNEADGILARLKRQPLMVPGSMGQDRPHPMLTEIRGHRALLAVLLKQLNLPDEDQEEQSRSQAAAHAARARWRIGAGA